MHVLADLFDASGKLVAGDDRPFVSGQRMAVMQRIHLRTGDELARVRSADPVRVYAHEQLAGRRVRPRHALDPHVAPTVVDGRAHRRSHCYGLIPWNDVE